MADKYLVVQGLLTDDECKLLLDNVLLINPRLRGAHVADVLDLFDDSDAFLGIREPLYEKYGDLGELHSPLVLAAILLIGPLSSEDGMGSVVYAKACEIKARL